MEREHEAADNGVIELGIASEVTHGSGDRRIDNPQGQSLIGMLDD